MKEKLSAAIYNEEQGNFYMSQGCIAKVWGRKYNKDKGQTFWFIKFVKNQEYELSKALWMSKRRLKDNS